ncbi:hypothetical protein BFW01_g12460 [Lasiodiplodia theobromae]|nr:hypothetical protein BFW01_g12460 [Lasiodiplodia theobromae]
MPPINVRNQAELQAQRTKLTNSYNELLDEFSSSDLRTVGNYQLGRLIGKGSFGKVYLASHKLTNGSKVVLKSANKNDSNLAREIHHHRQFLHPHIARLYEVIVTETLVWLVLEYCPGDELYNHLLRTGPMEPAKVQKIFTQLVGAVSYIHLKSCVHRDLKLENVLLDKHGNVKLVDFGFTREYEGKSNYLQTWCGTVCYSAPEMLKGEKYAGEKVDVWSLGVIVYALLCGELPFDEDDENETKRRILKEEPKYPDHMPEQAKDLIIKLLSKRPLLRPSLPEILQHPWLAEHAPQQQVILKLQQPPPFTTEIEKETLQRMRSAGVDIDKVIENVLAQRCDALAGWWALLLEKEERKAKRRERKRKEREAEAKSLRRLSAASRASSRLDRLAPTIREIDEEGAPIPTLGEPPKSRGRNRERTSIATSASPDLPLVPEASRSPNNDKPPPPVEKDRRYAPRRHDKSRTTRAKRLRALEAETEIPTTIPRAVGIAQALVQGVGETRKIQITRFEKQQISERESRQAHQARRHSEAFYYSDYKHRQTVVPGPTGIAEPRKLRRNAAAPTSFHQSKQWVEQEGISLPSADDAPVILPTQFYRPSRPQVHIFLCFIDSYHSPCSHPL